MRLRIVLADDNPAVLDMLSAVLGEEGFDVVGLARDGVEAIEFVERLRPDIVVLDLAMPRINGLDAAGTLHERCPECRVIILSAHSTERLIKDAFRSGARGYVVKGDDANDLVRAIRDVARGAVFLSPTAAKHLVQPFVSDPNDGRS